MIQWIIKILQNFSVYKLGWFNASFNRVFDWEVVAITVLVMLSVMVVFNIGYFLVKASNHKMYTKVYVPLCVFYIITNVIGHLMLACLFLSLGAVVWIVLISVYAIFLAVFSGITADEYKDYPGIFGFAAYVVQYSKRYEKYMKHKEAMQERYNRFLNIKYE